MQQRYKNIFAAVTVRGAIFQPRYAISSDGRCVGIATGYGLAAEIRGRNSVKAKNVLFSMSFGPVLGPHNLLSNG
jgi:hypothetical protein